MSPATDGEVLEQPGQGSGHSPLVEGAFATADAETPRILNPTRLRFRDGRPLLQELTAHWMLVQWEWQRERLNRHLHGALRNAVLRGEVPTGAGGA